MGSLRCAVYEKMMSTFIVPLFYANILYHSVLKLRCRSVDNLMLGVTELMLLENVH